MQHPRLTWSSPIFGRDLPMTSASRRKRRNRRGSRRARRMGCRRSEPWGSTLPSKMHRPAQRSLTSHRARPDYLRRQLGLPGIKAWLTRWLRSLSAVPELTRGIDIKLNARLSLRGHRNPIASSHRTWSPFGSAIRAIIPPLGALSPRDCRMVAGSQDFEQNESPRSRPAWVGVWHLWTVVIPRRSIAGRLVSGKVWRRHDGRRWTYKKFVEYRNDQAD